MSAHVGKRPLKRFSVRTDQSVCAGAQRVARERGMTCQALMRELIYEGLQKLKARDRKQAQPDA